MIVEQEPMDHPTQEVSDSKNQALHDKASGCCFRFVQGSLGDSLLGEETPSEHEKADREANQDKEAQDSQDQVDFVHEIEGERCSDLSTTSEGQIQGIVKHEGQQEEPQQSISFKLHDGQLCLCVHNALFQAKKYGLHKQKEGKLLQ